MTAFNFDGTAALSQHNNTETIAPSIDAVAEFKITTEVPSAEFAHSAGGAINVFIKNGTNEFHGSMFEFNRTKMLRALNYFDRGQPPNWNFNQFGDTAGGPIYFPKIYSGRNRSFFFASYQGTRHPYANPQVLSLPERSNPDTTRELRTPEDFAEHDGATIRAMLRRSPPGGGNTPADASP